MTILKISDIDFLSMLRLSQCHDHRSPGQVYLDLDYFVDIDTPFKGEVLAPYVEPSEIPLVVCVKAHAVLVLEGILVIFLRLRDDSNRKVILGSHFEIGLGCSLLG